MSHTNTPAGIDLNSLPVHFIEGVENGGYWLCSDVLRAIADLRAQLGSERAAKEYEQRHAAESEKALAEVQAQLASAQKDAGLLRTVVKVGMQLHFEGQGEDDAVWVNELMKWPDGDRLAATRALIEQEAQKPYARAQLTNTTGE